MSKEATIERLKDTYGEENFKEVISPKGEKKISAFFRRPSLSFFDSFQEYVSDKGTQKPFALMEACVKECFIEGDKGFLHNPTLTAFAFENISEYVSDFQQKSEATKKPLPATKSRKKAGN